MSVPNKCTCDEICGRFDNRRPHHAMAASADRASAPTRRSDFPRRAGKGGKALASRTRRARDAASLRARIAEGI